MEHFIGLVGLILSYWAVWYVTRSSILMPSIPEEDSIKLTDIVCDNDQEQLNLWILYYTTTACDMGLTKADRKKAHDRLMYLMFCTRLYNQMMRRSHAN